MMIEFRVMLTPWGVSIDRGRLEETNCRAGCVLYLHLDEGLQGCIRMSICTGLHT